MLYRSAPCSAYRTTRDHAILVVDGGAAVIEVTLPIVMVLEKCKRERTLDEHLRMMAVGCSPVQQYAVRRAIDMLVVTGLLRPAGERVSVVSNDDSNATRQPIGTVGIVTADRPHMLERCLRSLAAQCSLHSRYPRILVVDGSRDAANRLANAQATKQISALTDQQMIYVGPKVATQVAATLRGATGHDPLLDFALVTGTIGANRNLLQLLTIDDRLLMMDDDIVCDTWSLPERSERIAMASHDEFREVRFYLSRAEAIAEMVPNDVNILAEHGRILGQPLNGVLEQAPDSIDRSDACDHLLAALAKTRSPKIRASFCGIAGDSGIYCPHTMLFATGSVRAELAANRTVYETAMASRETLRIAKQLTLTHDPNCMAGCMGLDNSGELPPFLPVGRNEDGVFGAILAHTDAMSLFAHLPFGVVHDSSRSAQYSHTHPVSATETRLAELILALLPPPVDWPMRRGAKLDQMGTDLQDCGQLSLDEFIEVAVKSLVAARAKRLNILHENRSRFSYPDYMRNGQDEYRKTLVLSMKRPEFFVPVECTESLSVRMRFDEARRQVSRFGELLSLWPALRTESRAIGLLDRLDPQ